MQFVPGQGAVTPDSDVRPVVQVLSGVKGAVHHRVPRDVVGAVAVQPVGETNIVEAGQEVKCAPVALLKEYFVQVAKR